MKLSTSLQKIDAGGSVEVLAFSPDGKRFAWGTSEGHVRLWDVKEGERFNHKGPVAVTALTFVAGGKTWLTAYANGALEARDTASGTPVKLPAGKVEGIVRALYRPLFDMAERLNK